MKLAHRESRGSANSIGNLLVAIFVGLILTLAGMTQAMAARTNDFNGDTQTDVLWRNATTGQTYVWLMGGGTIASSGFLGTVADQNWQIAGTGDLNGDG